YHLTHLIRGQSQPGRGGNCFLFIEDPRGDLCSSATDPQGFCADHLRKLRDRVEQQGYTINCLDRRNATIEKVRGALADPSVLGVYYFGHGSSPVDGNEGYLVLKDGFLFARQIEEVAPAAKFVFLNACWSATAGRDWDIERRYRSVAEAFGRSDPGKV